MAHGVNLLSFAAYICTHKGVKILVRAEEVLQGKLQHMIE